MKCLKERLIMGNRGVDILGRIDWLTIILVLILMVCGWFSIVGSSSDVFGPSLFSFDTRPGKQLVWIGCAIVLGIVVISITRDFFSSYAYIIWGLMMVLLLATIFLAQEHKGSRSWLDIGPVSLQPAEFAKFATALALAKYVDRYSFNPQDMNDLAKAFGIFLLPMVLIVAQNETGSALVYVVFILVLYREGLTGTILFLGALAIVFFIVAIKYGQVPFGIQNFSVGTFVVLLIIQLLIPVMAWFVKRDSRFCIWQAVLQIVPLVMGLLVATLSIPFKVTVLQTVLIVTSCVWMIFKGLKDMTHRYFLVSAVGVLSIVYLFSVDYAFENILQDHQRTRINVILGLEDDPLKAGYNVNQSMIAIGSGGFAGKGFMKGTQTKLKYVPEQDTDFIFCTVGEEQGFLGSAFVLLLYISLVLRLLVLAERQPTVFGRVYGYSVLCILLFHVFVNIGMVLGILPVIGIPLPFFSYGGSSLWGFTILLSIFLRIDCERLADY